MEFKNTKTIIETEDPMELKRFVKSLDMASCLFDLQNSAWRKWKDLEPEQTFVSAYLETINDVFEDHGIVIDDLIE